MRKNGLAERVAKSATAIASYESGQKRPAPATVAQLALALGIEPAFFLPAPRLPASTVGAPHFRSLRSTSQLVRDQAYAFGRLAVAVSSGLERHVEFPIRDIEKINLNEESPEDAAGRLREAWRLGDGPIRNLVRAAESHGILVVFTTRDAATVDAYSFDNTHRPVVLLNPLKHDYFRQRFDLAHEVGHLAMHFDADPGGREVEDEAHRFASELLMPSTVLRDLLPAKADWRKLGLLKEQWGVSMQALLFKAKRLRVMSDVTYRNAMTTISTRGWRRQEPGLMPSVERPSLLPRAVELLVEEGLTISQLAEECRVPQALFEAVTSRAPS